MKLVRQFGIIIFVVIFILLLNSFFIIREGQNGLVLVLGHLKEDANGRGASYDPGLHLKFPFISSVKKFDTRLQGFSSGSFSAITSMQTFLEVEYFVKWRISDVALYYKRTSGSAIRASSLMESKINDIVRAQFGRHTSNQIISTQRSDIMHTVLSEAKREIEDEYGIEVTDVQLQSARLPTRVLKSVFNRMASERKQFANNKRAEGLKVSESIKAKADYQVVVIKAKARQQAADLKADGDKQAATIYADAYQQDADFFAFYRSLKAYQHAFNEDASNMLVLSTDSDFFKYFDEIDPNKNN
jgi:modulator of FtsH protease HflC